MVVNRAWRACLPAPGTVVALVVAAAGVASPNLAAAQPGQMAPWCASMGGQSGFDCSYRTFEQCMATARGLGNFCTPNPFLQDRAARPQRRVRNW